jgi:quercetin dioxygenase-like cupin family protein
MERSTETPRGAFFELAELLNAHARAGELSHRFINIPSLRLSIYKLPAGGADPQTPHEDDEVYYIISGRAKFQIDGELRLAQAGSIIFAATNVPHKFVEIEEDLTILVFYSHYKPAA